MEEPAPEAVFLQLLLAAGYISEQQLVKRVDDINRRLPQGSQRSLSDVRHEANSVFGALGMDLVYVRDDFDDGNKYFAVLYRDPLPSSLNRIVLAPTQAVQLKEMLERMFRTSRCRGILLSSLPLSQFPAKREIAASMLAEKRFVIVNPADRMPDRAASPALDSSEPTVNPASPASPTAQAGDAASTRAANLQDSELTEDSRIFVGTRLLYELEPYLVSEYGGTTLLRCLGCDTWLLKGRLCSNKDCGARLHERCYSAYFSSHGTDPGICPLCSAGI